MFWFGVDVLFTVIPLKITPDKYNSLSLKSYLLKEVYKIFVCNDISISCTFEKFLKSI